MTPILDENEAPCIDSPKQSEAMAHKGGTDLLSGYALLLFLMYINKSLCKLGPFEELFAWDKVSKMILRPPQGCLFEEPENFLTVL